MNYLMSNEFINFIKENGRDIIKNPQSFEASLQAYCSARLTSNVYKTEVFILSEALREGIIQELLEVKIAGDTLIRKLSKQLQAACGFTEYASNVAIDIWCYALGLKDVPVEKVEEAKSTVSSDSIHSTAANSSSYEPVTSRGIVMMVLGAVFFFLGLVLTADSYETAANRHRAAPNKSYTVFYGLVAFGAISFIRGFIQMIKYYTQPEKANPQSSTKTNYSQKTESTNTNYTKHSENAKQQNTDADYSNQTSNQSTKKEDSPKKEKTFEERLEELKRLNEKGIITEAEFQTRKIEILKEL